MSLEGIPHSGPDEVVGSFWEDRGEADAVKITVAVRKNGLIYSVIFRANRSKVARQSGDTIKDVLGEWLYAETKRARDVEYMSAFGYSPRATPRKNWRY